MPLAKVAVEELFSSVSGPLQWRPSKTDGTKQTPLLFSLPGWRKLPTEDCS